MKNFRFIAAVAISFALVIAPVFGGDKVPGTRNVEDDVLSNLGGASPRPSAVSDSEESGNLGGASPRSKNLGGAGPRILQVEQPGEENLGGAAPRSFSEWLIYLLLGK